MGRNELNEKEADLLVYPLLAVATSLYAVVLDKLKPLIEPNWTWAEVVAGCWMCITAARIRARLGPNTREGAERAIHRSFVVGGIPIIVWQLLRMLYREVRARRVRRDLS